jgi:hypothetical protein
MDHTAMLLLALTIAWTAGRWNHCLAPALRAAGAYRAVLHPVLSGPAPRASVRLEAGYATPLPSLRAHLGAELARHPLWDGGHWAMQVVDATRSAVVVLVSASAPDPVAARRLEADLRAALLLFLTRHDADGPDDGRTVRPAPAVPAGVLDR